MLVLNIIFFVSVYPIALLLYYFIKTAGNGKGKYCFGAVMKSEWLEDEDVKALIKDFNKKLNRIMIIFMLIPIAFPFIPYMGIAINMWIFWIYAMIIVPVIPIIQQNKKIKLLKKQKGWYNEEDKENKQKIYVELKSAGEIRQVRLTGFLIPTLIAAAAVVAVIFLNNGSDNDVEIIIAAAMAIVNPIFLLVAVWLDKQKTQVISNDSNVNVNYSRAKKRAWKNYWLECIWINTLVVVLVPVAMAYKKEAVMNTFLWFSIAECMIVIIITCILGRNINKIEKAYMDKNELMDSTEDDNCWMGGVLYYNPKDRHTMVSTRVGTGTTVNMATGLGKGLIIICIVIIIGSSIMTLSIIGSEFTPVHLKIYGETVVAEHTKREYQLNVSNITDIQLLTEMPSSSKRMGTGMENLLKGDFSVKDNGRCNLCLNPQNGLFVRIEADQKVYYFSGIDDNETREVYDALIGMINMKDN